MKKAIVSLAIVMILSMAMVNAFSFSKNAVVKGDWEWTGSWVKTNPITATYGYSAVSPLCTISTVSNYDNLGLAWKYIGESSISVNKPAAFTSALSAITVNDPATTPATGGYTQYNFHEVTQIDNIGAASLVAVDVVGEGAISLVSVVETDAESTQQVHVGINE